MKKTLQGTNRLGQTSDVRRQATELAPPPLSLYIHIPWCVRKCPYCDFNSHEAVPGLPEQAYIDAMLHDLQHDLHYAQGREINTVFVGGGTPSLFSATSIKRLLDALRDQLTFSPECEITLEANPGTFEQEKFAGYLAAGVNRLSIGVQSFQSEQLTKLGRIHSADDALTAIRSAQDVGFERINVDLMHGLPDQTSVQAETDIRTALDCGISHLSWYQLTIEANTHFHKYPPLLPVEDTLADIQQRGLATLGEYGLRQYEVSAYATAGQESRHNINYWQFGDYLAVGAGAHGKVTLVDPHTIVRYSKTRLPAHYLERAGSKTAQNEAIPDGDRAFEFLLNALRLNAGFTRQLFESRTGLPLAAIVTPLQAAIDDGLILNSESGYRCSERGRLFLDDVVARFLG
jgi:putative oxygen-independent coproporphyrinogen III oxidase